MKKVKEDIMQCELLLVEGEIEKGRHLLISIFDELSVKAKEHYAFEDLHAFYWYCFVLGYDYLNHGEYGEAFLEELERFAFTEDEKADFKDLREEMLTSKSEELKLVEIQLPEENDTFPLPKDQKHVYENQHPASEIEQHESVERIADITQRMERLEKTICEVIMQMGKKYNAEFLILHKEINDLKEIARRDTNEEQKFE